MRVTTRTCRKEFPYIYIYIYIYIYQVFVTNQTRNLFSARLRQNKKLLSTSSPIVVTARVRGTYIGLLGTVLYVVRDQLMTNSYGSTTAVPFNSCTDALCTSLCIVGSWHGQTSMGTLALEHLLTSTVQVGRRCTIRP